MQFISTSAIAKGRTLGQVVRDAVQLPYDGVEIAIGPRPTHNPVNCVQFLKNHGKAIRAHHSVPLGTGRILRAQDFSSADYLAAYLNALGIKHYSMHPPLARDMITTEEVIKWYIKMHDIFDRYGVRFAVETMYPDHKGGTRTLTGSSRVLPFLEAVKKQRPDARPLVLDVAHVYIGFSSSRAWEKDTINELLDGAPWVVSEVHYSANNGMDDNHRAITDKDVVVNGWLKELRRKLPNDVAFVDEARQR